MQRHLLEKCQIALDKKIGFLEENTTLDQQFIANFEKT